MVLNSPSPFIPLPVGDEGICGYLKQKKPSKRMASVIDMNKYLSVYRCFYLKLLNLESQRRFGYAQRGSRGLFHPVVLD